MACPRSWTALFFTIFFDVLNAQGNNKGLIVSTFPNWFFEGELNVFHGDPSTFRTNQTIGATTMEIGANSKITSIVANTRDNSLLLINAFDNTLYNYENFNLHMNHTSRMFSKIHTGVSATTSQIAVDWLARNVYWTDGYYDFIAVHPLKFPNDTSLYKILVSQHLTKPEGIAVDPVNRYLFWSDVLAKTSKIERATLTGERRTVIIKADNPIWISSIALDIEKQLIYWSDIGRQTIQYSDYNGNNQKVLVRQLGASFLAVSMSQDVICATEYKELYAMCFSKTTGEMTWLTSYLWQEPWALTVYDSDQQKVPATPSPCDTKSCEHMCFHTDSNTATCACKEGYKLNDTSCQPEHGLLFGKAIIVANSTDACMYDIHLTTNAKTPAECFLTNLTNLGMFAVDSHERKFYYIDYVASSIKEVDMVTGNQRVLFTETSLSAISGLSYDWNAKNLYWTDSARGTLTVHSVVTGATNELLRGLDVPKHITVSPHLGKMFWLTGSSSMSTLDSAKLDGSGLVTSLLNHGEITSPSGLFYDDKSGKLYWINDGDLVSMNPDGTNPVYHAFAGYSAVHALIYKDYSYWTTFEGFVEMAHLDSYYADASLQADYMGPIAAIGVYDVDVQPKMKNNCSFDNGGCEHICEPTGEKTMTCSCDFGYTLQADGHSCSSEPFLDSFALLPDVTHDKIYQVSLSDGEIRALEIPDINLPVSVIYDKKTEKIYWTNAMETEIRASPLKSKTSEVLYVTWSVLPIGLAFDHSTGILYYSTEFYFDGSYIGCLHPHVGKHHTLISRDLDLPKNIALYPSKGMMFWTDITTSSTGVSYIGSAYMDGTNIKKIVTSDLVSPNGLVIDYAADRIYWADAAKSIIASVDLNGNNRRTIILEQGAALVGLDLAPPYLYYVGRNKQRISKFDLTRGPNGTKVEFMNDIHALGRIESIRVYPEQTQPVNNYCTEKNGGCALFCFPIPGGRTCGCEDGETLNSDGKTCTGHISCDINIPNAILDQRCIAHADGTCDFTCASGYTKTVDVLSCDAAGNWNTAIHTACQSVTGTCSAVIPHGYIDNNCDRRISSMCSYSCSAGYVKANDYDQITCLSSGAWSKPLDQLCIASSQKCPAIIDNNNAQLDATCTRSAGSVCDYNCIGGYNKNPTIPKLVCLRDGIWNYNGQLCTNTQCPRSLQNGYFDNTCSFYAKQNCTYKCNTGFIANTLIPSVYCMAIGSWSFDVGKLCTAAPPPCSKTISNGKFIEPCSANHNSKCDYECNTGYVQQPIVQNVVCHKGQWTVDTNFLCLAQAPPISEAQNQNQDSGGTSGGAIAGIVIAVIIITAVIVLGVVYLIWRRTKPQGQYVSNNTNLKFKRFDDSNVPAEPGVTGFSNPITNQPDYGNFGTLREEGYITTDMRTPYENADPKNVNVTIETTPTANGGH